MTREFTGWHMLAIMVVGFGTIIAVNLTLAYNAVATFPGLETRNAYVASQQFEAARTAQDALQWQVETTLIDGRLTVAITDRNGRPVQATVAQATFGRATHTGADQIPAFTWDGTRLTAPVTAGTGNWNLRLELLAEDGTLFRRRIPLHLR